MKTRFIIDLTTGLVARSIAGLPESDELAACLTAGDTMECEVVFMAGATDVTADTLADGIAAALGVRAVPGVDPLLAMSTPIVLEGEVGTCTLDLLTSEVMALAAGLGATETKTRVWLEAVVGGLTVAQQRMTLRREVLQEGDEPPTTAEASRISATASAAAAQASANAAADSAAAAATSASAAAGSATAATAAQTAASAARDAALAAQTAAQAAQTASSASASAAAGSATAAATAQTAAETARTAAQAAQTAAETARTAAQASATAAATSATNAATSATNAAASETNAATSANGASTSATNASASATAAAASAAQAALISAGLTFISDIAGASVPATATASGYFYVINTAGTAQGKTWAVGDLAIFKGTSGQWSQIPASSALASQVTANMAATRNALAPQAALLSLGTAATNRLTWTLPASCALGTDARSFTFKIETPFAAPSATTVLFTWGDAASPTTQFIEVAFTSGDALRIRIYGATTSDYRERTFAGLISNYGANRAVVVSLAASTAGGLVACINGIAVTLTAEMTGGAAPADWQAALSSSVAAWHGGLPFKLFSWWPTNFALSSAEMLTVFLLGGGVPDAMKWGSQLNQNAFTNAYGFGAADANSITSVGGGSGAYTMTAVAGQRPGGAGNYLFRATRNNTLNGLIASNNLSTPFNVSANQAFTVKVWAKLTWAGTPFGIGHYPRFRGFNYSTPPAESSPDYALEQALSTSWTRYTFTGKFGSGGAVFVAAFGGESGGTVGDYIDYDDLEIYLRGALFFVSPQTSADGLGYQIHDVGANQVDGLMSVGTWTWTHTAPRGYVRGTLTWAGTHEGKSLLGQRAFPDGFLLGTVTLKPTASTSGSGCTLGTTNSATRWRGLTALTANTKSVAALANQLPAGTNANDADLVLDPDTANYTGSISLEVHYLVTLGT